MMIISLYIQQDFENLKSYERVPSPNNSRMITSDRSKYIHYKHMWYVRTFVVKESANSTALTLVVLIAPRKKWICLRMTYVGYFDVWNLAWKSQTPNPLKNRGHRPPKFWFWMKFAIKTSPSLHRWPSWPPDDLCRVFWCMKPCLEVSDPKPPEKLGPPASKVLILDEICN